MPEGDTIFRAARTLNRALACKVVTKFETQLAQLARVDYDTPIAGRTVEAVESRGKWMSMRFSGGLTLMTHMLMSGSWHIYRPGEAWQRPRQQMRAAVYTEDFVAVAFQIQIAEFHTAESLRRQRSLRRLGPDVLSPDFREAEAVAALQSRPELEVGVALLTQSIVAGIGNVYKSEVCFASGVNPFRTVASLLPEEVKSLAGNARKLMANSVSETPNFRRTTGRSDPAARLWVYKRGGEPCRECGTAIASKKQGEEARITFWCPQCQRL
ncbi:MAG: Fpg/Nei family DNA glycosylase [Acidobacteriota bacterium]|nr:Fpg/Nei family DNA glycosylase [Acidobacteriota bacterium]